MGKLTALLLAILLSAISAAAQGSHYVDLVLGSDGHPVSEATVTVCPAGALGIPCSPKTTVYSDQGLTQTLSNPFKADRYGNVSFWAAPGTYVVTFTGINIAAPGYSETITLPCTVGSDCAAPTLPLSIANGGTGTATPSLTAGLNIGITGSWPNQTIAVTGVLPVANGGTGTATPSLTAGLNIGITGAWPNQTIAVTGIVGVANGGTGASTLAGAGIATFTGTITTGDCAKFDSATGQLIDSGGGCTAASNGVASEDLTSQTASILDATMYTVPAAGFYRAEYASFLVDNSGAALVVNPVVAYYQHGIRIEQQLAGFSENGIGSFGNSGVAVFYADAGTVIQYAASTSGFVSGSGNYYDLHIRLEKVQ